MYPQSLQDPKMGGSRLAKMADEEEELGTSGHEAEHFLLSWAGGGHAPLPLSCYTKQFCLRGANYPHQVPGTKSPLSLKRLILQFTQYSPSKGKAHVVAAAIRKTVNETIGEFEKSKSIVK